MPPYALAPYMDSSIDDSADLPSEGSSKVGNSSNSAVTMSRLEFEEQIEPCIPRLYRLCLALSRNAAEAEDLLQNSLVRAYIHREAFAARGSLLSWLYTIVRHEHIEVMRTHKRRRGLLEVALERASDVLDHLAGDKGSTYTPEDMAIVNQEMELLLMCLRSLREPYRTTVLLCDVEELPYEEVATIVGAAVGTVKSRHARGRIKLRKAFEDMQRRLGSEAR